MSDTARLRELDDALRAYDRDLLASYDVHPEAYENDVEAGENRRALLDQLLRLAHPALLDALDAAEAEAERDQARMIGRHAVPAVRDAQAEIDALRAAVKEYRAEVARLTEAAKVALNFIANSESELGIELDSGKKLRAALEAKP